MTGQLALHEVTKRFGENLVLDQVTVVISPGERVGIIGDNGSGKSTLLKLMAGVLPATNGEITVHASSGVGYLAQRVDLPEDATVQDLIDTALREIRDLAELLHDSESKLTTARGDELKHELARYTKLTETFEARDGYGADTRVETAIHALGLPELDRGRALNTLSGGELSRLALAATLAADPELLLLDEPTNDLDDQAIAWLESRLAGHRGTVVAITHDRVFLDNLTTTILEVEERRVRRYGNGYEGYLAAKEAERRRRLFEYQQWREDLERNEKLVETNASFLEHLPRKLDKAGFGHGAFHARGRDHGARSRVRMAKERVSRLVDSPQTPPPDPLVFKAGGAWDSPQSGGDTMPTGNEKVVEGALAARLDDVQVADRLEISLQLAQGERLLITGPNGAGKTTLLKVLAGELEPDHGTVTVNGTVGYLRQEESLWPDRMTILQAFAQGRSQDLLAEATTLLSLGLFEPTDLRLRIGELSFGQRRRVELARVVSSPVDILLLDEPTNHLAPELVEQVEAALQGFGGVLILVTHDRRMRAEFAGTVLELANGRSGHL